MARLMTMAFYFGTWGYPGHFLYEPSGRTSPLDLLGQSIDGQFAPRRHHRHAGLCWGGQGATQEERKDIDWRSEEYPQGQFLRHRLKGFTLIQWWDRNQGDKRGACNGSFILEGDHSSTVMVAKFRELFPPIAEQLDKAGVKLVDVTPPAKQP